MADSLDSGDSREGAGPPLRRRWVVGEDVIELFFKLDFALSVVKFGLLVNNKGPLNMSLSMSDIEEYDTHILNNHRTGRLTVHTAALTIYMQTTGVMVAVGGDEPPELNYLPNEIRGSLLAPAGLT
jgi:hypothetical protein